MRFRFTKAEGSQNDFVIVDNRDMRYGDEMQRLFAIAVCHRRKGIGADGAIFIEPSGASDFLMKFLNPDGSVGSMCGNGGRCAALYAASHGIADQSMRIEVLGKEYRANVYRETVRLYFPEPGEIRLNDILEIESDTITCHYAHTGAPHAVVFIDELRPPSNRAIAAFPVESMGRQIRSAPLYQPVGANANFVSIDERGTISIRTFEKGVEAETEACGTGSVAAAIIASVVRGIRPPIALQTRAGESLSVGFALNGTLPDGMPPDGILPVAAPGAPATIPASLFAVDLYLEGRANLVFSGELEFDPSIGSLRTV